MNSEFSHREGSPSVMIELVQGPDRYRKVMIAMAHRDEGSQRSTCGVGGPPREK
jgi:hypothetical protein